MPKVINVFWSLHSINSLDIDNFYFNDSLTTSFKAIVNVKSNNSYTQINFQNESGGTQATTDWIATANNGTDTTYFVDLGIAGSGYDNSNPNIKDIISLLNKST